MTCAVFCVFGYMAKPHYYVTNPRSSKKGATPSKNETKATARKVTGPNELHPPSTMATENSPSHGSQQQERTGSEPPKNGGAHYYPIHAEETNRTPAAPGKRTRHAGTPMYRKMNKTT